MAKEHHAVAKWVSSVSVCIQKTLKNIMPKPLYSHHQLTIKCQTAWALVQDLTFGYILLTILLPMK